MKREIVLEELNEVNKIIEKFFSFFEKIKLKNSKKENIDKLEKLITKTERLIQDTSEKVNIHNEFDNSNVNKLIISLTVEFLKNNYLILTSREIKFDMTLFVIDNLSELNSFLVSNKSKSFSYDNAIDFFKLLNSKLLEYLKKAIEPSSQTLTINPNSLSNKVIYKSAPDYQNAELNLPDGENILYIGDLELWINTKDPVEANRFMFLVSDIISKIQNVELTLEDAKVGSYFQKIRIQIEGWFAKEEVKQIIKRSSEALESYSLDRHTEPIKKSQSERRKNEEEIERMMPKEMVADLQKIQLEIAREELESKRLDNIQKKLEINKTLSEFLQNGLSTIDSDYRISLNNIVLIEQNNEVVNSCNEIGKIDLGFRKKLIEESNSKKEINPTAEE